MAWQDRSGSLPRLLDHAPGSRDIFAPNQPVFFAFELVVIDKEIFKLVKKSAGHVLQPLDVGVLVICRRDRDETIVADSFSAVDLFSLDDSDERRRTSIGSPSGARVLGRKPKSCGNVIPAGRTSLSAKIFCLSSYANLLRLPFGVSTITLIVLPSSAKQASSAGLARYAWDTNRILNSAQSPIRA